MKEFPRTGFVDGNWSFRPFQSTDSSGVLAFAGFIVFPKGRRDHWSRRADMKLASDGKTWMFTAMHAGRGRPDARPTFAEAKAEVLRVLNQVEG